MPENRVVVVDARETIFFSYERERLRQWIMVTVESLSSRPVQGTVAIEAGGEEALTSLEIVPGVREYRCFAPTLWPDRPPVSDASVRLTVGDEVVTFTTDVGRHRPWTVYLLSDVCTDYTWVYDSVEAVHVDDAAITDAEIAVAGEMIDGPEANRNHYNFVHAREVEFYLEQYPDRAESLFDRIRDGTLTLNPIFNMCLTGDVSLEEMIRQFYPAWSWARQHGADVVHPLDIGYANHQETPTIAWAMATVLAGSGVDHLVKSILPYECPWTERLEEPPVFAWEGPDGSRVLVRWRNGDYVEGNFVLRDVRATNTAIHDDIIPRYEGLGGRYPFDAIALVGCYGDLAPHSKELPAKKAATIAAYNAQGWAYPKLVNASHKQFWDSVDAQIEACDIQVPVYRGDYGTSWEAWPACLAYDFAAWRRAQEWAGTADKLAALISRLDGAWYVTQRDLLSAGWRSLIYLADHAWNGANDANRVLNASLRRGWQEAANRAFDAVVDAGLAALGRHVPTDGERRIAVFNGLGWPRTGLARVSGVEAGSYLVDLDTGEPVPGQAVQEDGQSILYLEARDVPGVGYRVFAVRSNDHSPQPVGWGWKSGDCKLEGPFYAVEISPVTGGIVSLYDKVRGRELVDPDSPYHLNQCLYLSDGVEHTVRMASVEIGPCGSVFGQLIVRTALKNTSVRSTITLYTGLDRVDIRNEVEKLPTTEKQELDFAFPFWVPGRQYRFEAPGCIVTPGAGQRPGASQAVIAVRHFVDVFNDEFGVTLSQADSGLIEFGHRTTTEDPLEPDPDNSTVLTLAMENCIDWHEAIRDQAGVSHFVFRYSLRGHGGGFDPVAAMRFGWEDNNELLAIPLPGDQRAPDRSLPESDLPSGAHGFLDVTPDNVILTAFKVAEDDGLIVRLWECAGRDTTATVRVSGIGTLRAARRTDLLERDGEPLTVVDGAITVPVRAGGLATVRLLMKRGVGSRE
jgi:alpha-mannosidase